MGGDDATEAGTGRSSGHAPSSIGVSMPTRDRER